MTWIKVETCIHEKPEVFAIAEILDCDRDTVVGKLLRVWSWADAHTYATNATSVSTKLVDAVAQRDGFAIAMQKVGWLAQSEDGFSFPNFDRHNGNTAKSRALTAKRVAKHAKQTNASLTLDALAEKRREEKNTNTVDSVFSKPKKVNASLVFSDEDIQTANWMFKLIQGIHPGHKTPSFEKWANDIRLMRECDSRTDSEIRRLFAAANSDSFWQKNILSPGKLREKWDKLVIVLQVVSSATNSEPKREKTVYPRPARSAS